MVHRAVGNHLRRQVANSSSSPTDRVFPDALSCSSRILPVNGVIVHRAVGNHLRRQVANSSSSPTDRCLSGDPLSVAIFQTVMNTLSDTLCTRDDLGFTLPSSSISVNHLLYVDDACIVCSTPAGCQHLLGLVQQWLEWA